MDTDIDTLASHAMAGDKDALDGLMRFIYPRIYRFALKMLYHPQDAEDAAQEIAIKIITRLSQFRQESGFYTWAMAIAANHLRNARKQSGQRRFTLRRCEDMILREMPDPKTHWWSEAEQGIVVEEMRILCVLGMFQCLDWDHRIAYVLGEAMDISGPEGAAILGIRATAFRKRLSRARQEIRRFLVRNCELFGHDNPCRCKAQAMVPANAGIIGQKCIRALSSPETRARARTRLRDLDALSRQSALMRMAPGEDGTKTFVAGIRGMLDTGLFTPLNKTKGWEPMTKMIGFCGLCCSECPSYLATIHDDDTARQKTAAMYKKTYGFDMKPEDINCLGCHSDGPLISYCRECAIRQCGQEKGLLDCIRCTDQPCEKLRDFHRFSPHAKASYEALLKPAP